MFHLKFLNKKIQLIYIANYPFMDSRFMKAFNISFVFKKYEIERITFIDLCFAGQSKAVMKHLIFILF